jgi:integrase
VTALRDDDVDVDFEAIVDPGTALSVVPDLAPNIVAAIFDERVEAEDMAFNALSPNTLRAYATDWRAFSRWCGARGYVALPAEPAVLAMYIPFIAKTLKAASIGRRLAAIVYKHSRECPDVPSPLAHPKVKDVWKGVRREIGIAQHGVDAMTIDMLRATVAPLTDRRVDVRDRAVLLVQFAAALRRSELCALNVGDVKFEREGAMICIRRSKTDQEGEGVLLGVPFGSNPDTCPVRALQAWISTLDNAGDEDPLFVALHGPGHGVIRLRTQAVATIIKRRMAAAAIAGNFSGHSPRVGFITSCAAAGVDALIISNQTRHKSLQMIKRYTRPTTIWKMNAAFEVGL